jgi:hypothetical protein
VAAALPLLTLLVDHLAADDDALAVEGLLSPLARRDHDARLLLGLAAARVGQHERARGHLEGHRGARSVEPLLVLARAALASGDLEAGARDLAAVRERDPLNPQLRDLEGALAARRAEERLPFEAALLSLVDSDGVDAAEPRVRALLARFPESEVGRRILQRIDEQRRTIQIRQLLADAEEAAMRDELALALALLGQALAAGPRVESLASIHARVEEIKATLRDRAERAEVDGIIALLGDRDRGPGLLAYLALSAPVRASVRARVDLPHFAWLSEIGDGARPRAAALAVIALERAGALLAEAPQAALDRIDEHEVALRGVGRRAEIQLEARAQLDALGREAALRRVSEARAFFEAGAFERAEALLTPDLLGDLDEKHRERCGELRSRVVHAFEGRRLTATFEQRRREGHLLAARETVDELLEREHGSAGAAWATIRGELGAEIRQAFRLRKDLTARPFTSFRSIDLENVRGIQCLLAPESNTAPFVQTCGVWVFVRVVDLTARVERARFLLRTPTPMDLLSAELDGDRIIAVGKLGSVLELRLDDGEVLGWYESPVPRHAGSIPESVPKTSEVDGSLHAMIIESVAVVPGTRLLWQVVCLPRIRRRFVRICDLAQRRVVRELRETAGTLHLEPLMKRAVPLMAVVQVSDEKLVFHDPRGLPIRGGKLAISAMPANIVVEPGGERIVLFTGRRKAEVGIDRMPIRWCVVTPGGEASPELPLDVFGPVDCIACSDAASGLVFFEHRVAGDRGGTNEVRAFQLSRATVPTAGTAPGTEAPRPSFEEVYRAPIPGRSLVIQSNQRPGLVTLVADEGELEVTALGAEPPSFRPRPRMGQLRFKSINGLVTDCNEPTGTRLLAKKALLKTMQRESRSDWLRRIAALDRESDPERMLDLSYALEALYEPHESGNVNSWAFSKHPQHPEVRVNQARPLVNLERWSEVLELLTMTDPSGLDDGTAQHLHHMLGRAFLFLGEPEEARRILERGARYRDGKCDLEVLVAIATPLAQATAAEDREWTPDQLAARELVRAVETADSCLARGDAAGAIVALDRLVITEAGEVQSLARRAEAQLLVREVEEEGLFEKARSLAWFCAVHAEKKPFLRRELPMPRGRWDTTTLDALAARATKWLNATLGEAFPLPPGGL